MIIMRFIACAHQQSSNSDAGVAGLSQYKDLWLLRLPTAPTTMRNLVLAHTLICKIKGLEPSRKAEVLASLNKTDAEFQTTFARVTAKLKAQGMSAILNTAPVWKEEISRGMAFEKDTDVLNKNVTIYQDALARLGSETLLIRAERLRVSGLRPSASSAQNFSESDMQSQMEAFLRRQESERPARSGFSRMGSRIGSFLSRCVSFFRRTPVTDPISLQATELISASTEAFRAGFGAKNTWIFTEMLKGLDISDQLSTLNSEYANPVQKEAVKSALTQLVQYHIEQGTGIEFTSAAINGQISKERAVHDRDKGEFLRNDSLGSLAFSTFAKAVGGDCLIPIKEKIDAIGNAERMAIHSDLAAETLQINQAALIAATTEVFDIVASLDSRMPESLKAVLRDVITAAGDEGKTAFNSTFFLRFLVPFLSVSRAANSPNNESNKIIAAVLQKTANAWSRGETTVSFREPAQKFLEPLASQMIGEIDALVDRIKDDGGRLSEVSYPVVSGGSASRRSDDTAASSEADRNLDSEDETGLGSPAQSAYGNFWDGLYAPPSFSPEGEARNQELFSSLSWQTPFDRADEGQVGAGSCLIWDVSLHRAPDSDPYQRVASPNATLTLFSSGVLGSAYFNSGSPSEGSSTERSLAHVFDAAASASALRPTLPLGHVGGGGSIAKSSVRTAASGRQNSRYKASPSTPRKTARAGASPKVAQTRLLSPDYTAASKEIDAHTHKHWGEPILQKKLQAVLDALPAAIPAEERESLQAEIDQALIASEEAGKTIASLEAGETTPSPKKIAQNSPFTPSVALRRAQVLKRIFRKNFEAK